MTCSAARLWLDVGPNREQSRCGGALWQLMAQVHTKRHLKMNEIKQICHYTHINTVLYVCEQAVKASG